LNACGALQSRLLRNDVEAPHPPSIQQQPGRGQGALEQALLALRMHVLTTPSGSTKPPRYSKAASRSRPTPPTSGFVLLKMQPARRSTRMLFRVFEATPERHDAGLALAKVLALDGDYAAAAELYRRALANNPDDTVTRANLGLCQLEIGERDAGEASLRAATRGVRQTSGQSITALASASRGHSRPATRLRPALWH
jgi:Tfp pilus assembly protein PilF